MDLEILRSKKVGELREIAKALHIKGASSMKKQELFDAIVLMAEEAEKEAVEKEAAAVSAKEQPAAEPAPDEKKGEETAAEPAAKKHGEDPAEKAAPAGKQRKKSEKKTEGAVSGKNGREAAKAPEATEAVTEEKPDKKTAQPVKAEESEAKPEKKRGRKKKVREAEGSPKEDAAAKTEEQNPQPAAETPREPQGEKPVIGPTSVVTIELCGEEGVSPDEDDEEEPVKPEAKAEPKQEQPARAAETQPDRKKEKKSEAQKDGRYETRGILEITDQGYGFLRFDNFESSDQDIYVSPVQIRRFNLKTGDMIECVARVPNESDKFGALLFVRTVNGDDVGKAIHRKDFADLTPTYPEERITLEKGSSVLSMRMTDLVAPIGKGQRGLIVAPPKAGKTTLLKQIARSIENQNVDSELIVLLIDERPEEVTDMKRSIKGQVIYSTFDEQPAHHVKVAEMVLARAQRLAEHGKDVIILLDSITRLARAYNLVEPSSGRTLSGGLDPAALYKPKKFFGAARNTAEGGSITILATALIETGSRMDDMIFEEFKGTGNMELHLDRKLSEKRIFPAINLNKSGTRREDMLMSSEELEAVWLMRRAVADMGIQDATERIVFELVHSKTNNDFINRIRKIRLV